MDAPEKARARAEPQLAACVRAPAVPPVIRQQIYEPTHTPASARMPFTLVVGAAFLPDSVRLTVDADDVTGFGNSIKKALGVPDDIACTFQYEDPDFNEW